tara:strand:+ start:2029 stop:2226 length:198 start_codon:yes stop_codon:yes gene_type:complete
MIFEMLYSKHSFIMQLFRFFRLEMGHGYKKANMFTFITLGIWKFDVSLTIEKDENAQNIKAKWTK